MAWSSIEEDLGKGIEEGLPRRGRGQELRADKLVRLSVLGYEAVANDQSRTRGSVEVKLELPDTDARRRLSWQDQSL